MGFREMKSIAHSAEHNEGNVDSAEVLKKYIFANWIFSIVVNSSASVQSNLS